MSNLIKTISRVDPPYPFEAYTHVISPIPVRDGGGFLITIPDLPGCMSDGETEDLAVANGLDAFYSWVSACVDRGLQVPEPMFYPELPAFQEMLWQLRKQYQRRVAV